MSANSGTVLVVDTRNPLSGGAVAQLTAAGYEVVTVADPRKLVEAARGRTVTGLFAPTTLVGGVWRRWKGAPEARGVPVVLFAQRRPTELPFPWPLGAFMRADGYLSGADVKRSGAAVEALTAATSAARARSSDAPPSRDDRLGQGLWRAGSLVYLAGVPMVLAAFAQVAVSGKPDAILLSALSIGGGSVLMELGASVGRGRGWRLAPDSWAWVAFLVLATTYWFGR